MAAPAAESTLPTTVRECACRGGARMFQSRSDAFNSGTAVKKDTPAPIRQMWGLNVLGQGATRPISIPWAMEMKAVSMEEPSRLVRSLTGAILGCGGWVLSRGASDTGTVSMLFEFERQACVDIYSVVIAAGVELSQNGHVRFTELCQCTRSQQRDCGAEIASVDLEIQTFPVEMTACSSPMKAV